LTRDKRGARTEHVRENLFVCNGSKWQQRQRRDLAEIELDSQS